MEKCETSDGKIIQYSTFIWIFFYGISGLNELNWVVTSKLV